MTMLCKTSVIWQKSKRGIRGDLEKTWTCFGPELSRRRLHDINNPASRRKYGLLNGQNIPEQCMTELELATERIHSIVIFSDGMVSYGETADERIGSLAGRILASCAVQPLEDIIWQREKEEEMGKGDPHLAYAEKTIAYIRFKS